MSSRGKKTLALSLAKNIERVKMLGLPMKDEWFIPELIMINIPESAINKICKRLSESPMSEDRS